MRALMQPKDLVSIREEIDRFFNRVMDDGFGMMANGDWQPPLDVTETKDSLIVRLEVPGLEPKDIHVKISEGVLTVWGEKKSEREEKEATHYRLERKYGAFSRSVRLPQAVDGTRVNAQFRNGLLTILLPRVAGVVAETEVPIKVA